MVSKILTFARTPGVSDGNTREGPGFGARFWGEGWVAGVSNGCALLGAPSVAESRRGGTLFKFTKRHRMGQRLPWRKWTGNGLF